VFPDGIETERVTLQSLPRTWHRAKDESLRAFGDDWIRAGKTALLYVPSAAIRGEWNVLLNPAHSGFKKVKILDPEPFEFDVRMFR
jgi:RES domain-containing protein